MLTQLKNSIFRKRPGIYGQDRVYNKRHKFMDRRF